MFFLCVYVPHEHAEMLKQALFSEGAGQIGDYQQCCWQSAGQGQFLGNASSQPSIGLPNTLTLVEEVKIELLCDTDHMPPIIEALIKAHPYETPAYAFWPVQTSIQPTSPPNQGGIL